MLEILDNLCSAYKPSANLFADLFLVFCAKFYSGISFIKLFAIPVGFFLFFN
jgi:hypothetical protein